MYVTDVAMVTGDRHISVNFTSILLGFLIDSDVYFSESKA
jgi:hypothetical protein